MTSLVLSAGNWFDSVVNFFENINTQYQKYRGYRATVNTLSSLSDKELKDIGISRGMIHSIAMEIYTDAR